MSFVYINFEEVTFHLLQLLAPRHPPGMIDTIRTWSQTSSSTISHFQVRDD